MSSALYGLRTVHLAVTLALALGLCACAEKAPPDASQVIWNSDRVTPSSSRPVDAAGAPPVPAEPSGAPVAAPSVGSGSDAAAPPAKECREFADTVTIGGRPRQAYGRACLQPDGTWRVERPAQMPQLPSPSAQVATSAPYPAGPYFPATGGSMFFGSDLYFGDHPRHHFRRY